MGTRRPPPGPPAGPGVRAGGRKEGKIGAVTSSLGQEEETGIGEENESLHERVSVNLHCRSGDECRLSSSRSPVLRSACQDHTLSLEMTGTEECLIAIKRL